MNSPSWLKTDVSRETFERLEAYVALIEKWNPKINLVSKSSLPEIWDRHIWDSAQIFDIAVEGSVWADFGSGGGLPGIVLAIFAKELRPDMQFYLVESDQRKCAFLRNAVREIGLNVKVHAERIEVLDPIGASVISARALTDLNGLLEFVERHSAKNGVAILPKGETWEKEILQAQENWSFEYEEITSKTNNDAAILKIKDFARV
ncbi:MAG: 16S rRNA (guanine(527)-N(7))-methyltransferase RsmG [Ascidiaceihabitans sp.]|jgi:16S rRNA (guanine527-N7)-methyltransferase|tara:strand:+ start:4853 stop:5467 length:615 start_codon:yes stop_codon:yes gene_type:complete